LFPTSHSHSLTLSHSLSKKKPFKLTMASAASPPLISLLLLLTISALSATAFTDNDDSLISSSVAVTPAHAPSPHGHHHHHHAPTPSPHAHGHGHHRHPNKTHAPTTSPTASPPAKSPHHAPSPHAPLSPPTPAPSPKHAPPTHSPVSPPAAAPVPSAGRYPFQRFLVAVQGVVYCKPCKYSGVDTLLGATPVLGATVKLQCNNTRVPQVMKATTDKNGYFKVKAPKTITNYGVHKCKASLESSPDAKCSFKSGLHGGTTGGSLRVDKKFVEANQTYVLFTVGPFAFEPKCH
ncbi:Non-classical arabinogalactan protein 31, partial [Linum grandiflorum]